MCIAVVDGIKAAKPLLSFSLSPTTEFDFDDGVNVGEAGEISSYPFTNFIDAHTEAADTQTRS